MACKLLSQPPMSSSYDSIYKKLASSLGSGLPEHGPEAVREAAQLLSPAAAHELNNLLTIIQGYADRLLARHAGEAELSEQLKLIAQAARRATVIVHGAGRPTDLHAPSRQSPPAPPPPA
jgi:hypothetical protein